MDYGFLAIFTGLASAICYGASDFGGGFASRRREAMMVVLVSQAAGMVLLLLITFFLNEPLPPTADLFASAAAGMLGTIGLVRFYQELALGRMGIIAPAVAVVTVAIPVLFSATTEGLPQANQVAGILLAILAIWLITRSGNDEAAITLRDMAVILLIGLMFSSFLVTIGTVSERSVTWPLVASRFASIVIILVVLGFTGRWRTAVPRRQIPMLSLIGFLDVGGSFFYAISSALGRLDMAAVVASLYPGVTVILARVVLSEEIGNKQWLGIAMALAAIVLITL
jgi:drug/metabolite transporter (DMT)-like permease